LGLDSKVVSLWAEGPFNPALEAMDEFQMAAAIAAMLGTTADLRAIRWLVLLDLSHRTTPSGVTETAWIRDHCRHGTIGANVGIRAMLDRANKSVT